MKSATNRRAAAVLTVSDSVSAGARADLSGDACVLELSKLGFSVVRRSAVPDDKALIQAEIRGFLANGGVELVLSTGGTGLGPRDVTPEAVRPLLDREIPGYGELLRSSGLAHTPMAILARSFAGSIGSVLVVALPGSPKAVSQGIAALAPSLGHALDLLAGETRHR